MKFLDFISLFSSWHIAGTEGLAQWLEDPTYPNTTLSWNIIHGEIERKRLYLVLVLILSFDVGHFSLQEVV